MANKIVLYTLECNIEGLETLWQELQRQFNEGLIIAEFFDENVMAKVTEQKQKPLDDLVSARFFDGKRQVKIRRIKDALFWAAADFELDGLAKYQEFMELGESNRDIILWGAYNQDIQGLFEERIPYIFDTQETGLNQKLSDKDMIAIKVSEYKDKSGYTLWESFSGLEKWSQENDQEARKDEIGGMDHRPNGRT